MKRHGWRRLSVILVLLLLVSSLLAPVALASGSVIHVVQRGETLAGIAARYGVNMWTLASLNGITNVNRIYVGQRLTIPTASAPPPPAARIHVVRAGETLGGIARLYGVDVWALARTNGIYNLNRIYVGQRLAIPGGLQPSPSQPPPPPPAGWSVQYFNNRDLSGAPVLTTTASDIQYNWGWGAPAAGVSADNFSARWTRTTYMAGGTYRVTARMDDGVRVYIDDALVIDGWTVQAVITYMRDVYLAAGNHTIRVEYFEAEGVAEIGVSIQGL